MTAFDVRCLIPSIILIITLRVKDEKLTKKISCKNELPRICFDQAGVTFV